MSITSKSLDDRFLERGGVAGSRFPENYIREKRAWYKATGGETSISAGDLEGDQITWSSQDHLSIRVIRSTLSELIPYRIGMGASDWTVKLINPPTIEFSTALGANEIVDVIAPNRFQSIVRPEEQNFVYMPFEVAASSSQSTFTLSRPLKLTYYNGRNRGMHYTATVDGDVVKPNTPGNTDNDYTENQISGTDTFGSITFNTAIGLAGRAINVDIRTLGFYNDDNVSLQQLTQLQSQVNTNITDGQTYTVPITATTTPPTKGTTTVDLAYWARVGKYMFIQYSFEQSGVGTAGSGTYLFGIPSIGVTIDSSLIQVGSSQLHGICGTGSYGDLTPNTSVGFVKAYNSTNLAIIASNGAGANVFASSSNASLATGNRTFSFSALIPITEWSSSDF